MRKYYSVNCDTNIEGLHIPMPCLKNIISLHDEFHDFESTHYSIMDEDKMRVIAGWWSIPFGDKIEDVIKRYSRNDETCVERVLNWYKMMLEENKDITDLAIIHTSHIGIGYTFLLYNASRIIGAAYYEYGVI